MPSASRQPGEISWGCAGIHQHTRQRTFAQSTKLQDVLYEIRGPVHEQAARLEAEGHRAIIVCAGGAHPLAFVAHALTFVEMLEQSKNAGVELDYIYHTDTRDTVILCMEEELPTFPVTPGEIDDGEPWMPVD